MIYHQFFKRLKFFKRRQGGNIFALMFAAVAMVGVVGVVGMQTISGPITTITKVTQKNIVDTDIMTNGRIVILNAATLDPNLDGDPDIEPVPFIACTGTTPINAGGCLPTDIGAVRTDPWGTEYGYCVWNNGATNTGVVNMIDGATDNDGYVVAIISAGPDKVFNTGCYPYDGSAPEGVSPEIGSGMRVTGTDDIAKAFTYQEAVAGSGGLWNLVGSNAELDASVTGSVNIGASASIGISGLNAGIADFLGVIVDEIIAKTDEFMSLEGALLLDNAGTTTADTCGAPQEGALRLNAALDTLQICNGTAFVDITSDAWRIIDTSWGSNTYVSVAGVNNSANTDTIDFVTSGSSRMTVSPTGLVSVSGNTVLGDALTDTVVTGGNTTIGQDLAVNRDATVTRNLAVDTDTLVVDATNNIMRSGTNTLYVDVTNNRVGVGMIPSAAQLDVRANLRVVSAPVSRSFEIKVGDNTLPATAGLMTTSSSGGLGGGIGDVGLMTGVGTSGMYFLTSNAGARGTRMVIEHDGDVAIDTNSFFVDAANNRVGVGTDTPSERLDVAGNGQFTGTVKIGTGTCSTGADEGKIRYTTVDDVQFCDGATWQQLGGAVDFLDDIGDVVITAVATGHGITWDGTNWVNGPIDASTAVSATTARRIIDADSDTQIQVEEGADDDTIRFDTFGSERMTINANGHVTINTPANTFFPSLLVNNTLNNGVGVRGFTSDPTSGFGVQGSASGSNATGVYGDATNTTGQNIGVYGRSFSTIGTGVQGWNTSATGTGWGVRGLASSPTGTGVYGWTTSLTGIGYAVSGQANSPDGFGGHFTNDGGGIAIQAAKGSLRLTNDATVCGTAQKGALRLNTSANSLQMCGGAGNWIDYPSAYNSCSGGGQTWTARTAAEANQWFGLTYGQGLFVATAYSGTNQVMTSPDGITWTPRSVPGGRYYAVTYGNGLFVAVSTLGANRVITSPDGITWTARAGTAGNEWDSVTYGNGLFVALSSVPGPNQVMTSPDGITWTERVAAEPNQWRSVTYGGGQFVAVSNSGTNRVMTSPDGITWTARTAAAANGWWDVTYGNGLFVALATSGTSRIMTSPDGITWTLQAGTNNSWGKITYGNGLFVATTGGNSLDRVWTSPDGITWTQFTVPEADRWVGVAYGNGLFVAVSRDGPSRVMTSSGPSCGENDSGISWSQITGIPTGFADGIDDEGSGSSNKIIDTDLDTQVQVEEGADDDTIRFDTAGTERMTITPTIIQTELDLDMNTNNILDVSTVGFTATAGDEPLGLSGVGAGGNGGICTPGGQLWVSRNAAQDNTWRSVAFGNGVFVAVSEGGTNRVMTSPDGITWTVRNAAEANTWWSVTFGGGQFVAVATTGTNRIMTSPDGITWTARAAPEANAWTSVTHGGGLFVAVASTTGANRVMTSPDGVTWTPRVAAEANDWQAVTYGGGQFVAVASTGTNRVMTSPNGVTWTARAAAQANDWRSVVYGNGIYVAVAQAGTNRVMTSTDGITWTARNATEANQWRSVIHNGAQFIAVSLNGTNQVMVSTDGITWAPNTESKTNQWIALAYGANTIVSVSYSGTERVMTSTYSPSCGTATGGSQASCLPVPSYSWATTSGSAGSCTSGLGNNGRQSIPSGGYLFLADSSVAPSNCDSGSGVNTAGVMQLLCNDGVLTVVSQNCVGTYYHNGRCSCFTAETLVAMADGTFKEIHKVEIGEFVKAMDGQVNKVIDIDRTLLWKNKPQHLISINGEKPFMTDNHPVLTQDGWKAVNPDLAVKEAYDILAGKVTKLVVGDKIILDKDKIIDIKSIEIIPNSDETKRLYNLHVDGNHTYIANDMVVHGVVPDKAGRYTLDYDHNGEGHED